MIQITNPEIFGKTIAQALVKIETSSLKTYIKIRWINAIAKAVHLIEDQPEFLEFHPELDMLTVWNYETNMVYNANGKCECESFRRGNPCKHRSAKQLIKNYLAALEREAADVLAEVEADKISELYLSELLIPADGGCECVWNWEDKFVESYCPAHQVEADEHEDADRYDEHFNIQSYSDAPYLKSSNGKNTKIGNIRI